MSENNMNIILESLAETIDKLRLENHLLKYENERLKAEIKDKEGLKNA